LSVEARKQCCHIRKVEPLQRALRDVHLWLTGMRRQQSITRTQMPFFENDAQNTARWKLHPLADWTEEQVWQCIKAHNIPYHPLHDKGFPSIGCAPCTRAIQPGEDIRAGRWWWEDPEHKECGLHR
ncbi:MAG: phosphoadenylyl-sulfate reductase, partial [Myxococcota bacterium]